MSDQDGNIVKLVDRSEFAHANRSKDYLSGFEHESLETEDFEIGTDEHRNIMKVIIGLERDAKSQGLDISSRSLINKGSCKIGSNESYEVTRDFAKELQNELKENEII